MNTLVQQFIASTHTITMQFVAIVRRHIVEITFALSLALTGMVLLLFLKTSPPREVTLLTGPAGGGGEKLGEVLQERLQASEIWSGLGGRSVNLTVKPSQGFEDNREQINEDSSGALIGFTHDGFGASDNVRILLPLAESYVHIIVSKELYNAAVALSDSESDSNGTDDLGKRTFDQIAPLLRSPGDNFRCSGFLGPPLSGTRQTATLILEHYGIDIDEVDSGGNYDWEEMKTKLVAGDIHLAFFTSEPGAPVIEEIAKRRRFYLLGLSDAMGIRTQNRHLAVRPFYRNSYGAASTPDTTFCSTDLETIATRRVIICSRAMSESQGYWLATQLRAAIRQEVPTIQWSGDIEESTEVAGFTYPLHIGADPLRLNRTPWYSYIPSPFWSPLLLFGVSLLVVALRHISGRLPAVETERGTGESTGDPLYEQLVKLNAQIEKVSKPVTTMEYRKWQSKVREIRRDITRRVKEQNIDESLREGLLAGLGELQFHLEELNPSFADKWKKDLVASG